MISIGINLILGMLLTCALILGVRLEKKLRGLRDSHADFAKAVNELDGAAARTESSLHALRAGAETAKTEIASRIDQARIACQRLEKLSADAERLANQPLPLGHPMTPPPALARQAAAPPLAQASVGHASEGMSAIAQEMLRPAAPVQTRPAPAPITPRSRARLLDDDLFSLEPPPAARKIEFDAYVEERPMLAPAFAEPAVTALRADNDPLVGVPQAGLGGMNRAAREAFYREVLERDTAAPDPFESDSHFAYERRAMLAAVMGGRR